MRNLVTMIALVVGAYVAGYNGITHVEVMEMIETVMTYVEGMMEYAESFREEASSVVESVSETVEGIL